MYAVAYILSANFGPMKDQEKLLSQPALVFQAVWRSIGISFQSAIIAHRLNLICYDDATTQSYFITSQNFILY